MAIIVIAYHTHVVDGETVRIYNDSTEKYFNSIDDQDAKDYIEYLSSAKGMCVDTSPITIYAQGDFDVDALFRADALAKLSTKEKEVLGL